MRAELLDINHGRVALSDLMGKEVGATTTRRLTPVTERTDE